MEQEMLLISEAAKKVQVETHVLRYWEEELQLPIKRNEMGHRYYTMEDVDQFKEIKMLKEQGLQLKAIRTILQNKPSTSSANTDAGVDSAAAEEKALEYMIGKKQKYIVHLSEDASREEKVNRLQYLLQHMMVETVKTANKELCDNIKESILKELDYQFRAREEREEEHWKKEEEHYRKVDEMLRLRYKPKEKALKNKKERKNPLFQKH
ncbi:MAG: helix-turn-helix domain-containing protein [Muribaculaceae bacterium]|nr:helix-turn-helix domain-containing protein [Muribaculaceae bacterium]